jgi:LysM repeat protein
VTASEGPSTETSGGVVVATSEDRVTYVIQPGDTLGEIAAQFGVTLSSLAEENGIRNWDIIEVGTVLVIPGG